MTLLCWIMLPVFLFYFSFHINLAAGHCLLSQMSLLTPRGLNPQSEWWTSSNPESRLHCVIIISKGFKLHRLLSIRKPYITVILFSVHIEILFNVSTRNRFVYSLNPFHRTFSNICFGRKRNVHSNIITTIKWTTHFQKGYIFIYIPCILWNLWKWTPPTRLY